MSIAITVKSFLANDTVRKVVKTFVEAVVAQEALSGPVFASSASAEKAAIAGGAAALAFLWNGVIVPTWNKQAASKASAFQAAVDAAVKAQQAPTAKLLVPQQPPTP